MVVWSPRATFLRDELQSIATPLHTIFEAASPLKLLSRASPPLFWPMSGFLLPLPSQLRRAIFQQAQSCLSCQQPASHFRFNPLSPPNNIQIAIHKFVHTSAKMSDLSVELTAPNGRKYTQPTGLFINNEWVKSSNSQKLTSINPTYALNPLSSLKSADNP